MYKTVRRRQPARYNLKKRRRKQTFKNVNTWCVLVPVTSTVSIIVNSTPFLWVNDIICSFLQNSCPANCKRKHGERKGGAMKSPGGDDEHTICPTSEEFSHSRLKKHTVQIICPTSEEFSHNRLKKRPLLRTCVQGNARISSPRSAYIS